MRIHPVCLLLAVAATVFATPKGQSNCNYIRGCTCKENNSLTTSYILKIEECDSPLELTKNILSGISKKVTAISFKHVDIKRIDKDAFTDFEELEAAVFEDSAIEFIDAKSFDLSELSTLTFNKTTFGEVPKLDSEYLEELVFIDCKLKELPIGKLPGLSFLSLINNFISDLDENAFSNLEGLEELNLANNSIKNFSPSLFLNNKNLATLTLDNNPLTSIQFNYSTFLEVLSLNNCNLTVFDKSVTQHLQSVSTLYLSGNQLSILPIDVFEPMKELNIIDLSSNKLTELDDDIFAENVNLDKIVLDKNKFEVLPRIKDDVKLTHYSCKDCGLKTLEGAFNNLKYLECVTLSNNKIENIDEVFTELNFIRKLSLSNNKITKIGINAFGKNFKLKQLDLSHNPLHPLDPTVFASLAQLTTLNVSNCQLKELWSNRNSKLPKLENLFIDNNQLKTLFKSDMEILPSLKNIDLRNNPFDCTEHILELKEMITFLTSKNVNAPKTHQELSIDMEIEASTNNDLESMLPDECALFDEAYDEEEEEEDDDAEEDIDNDVDVSYESDEKEEVQASVLNTSGFNLAKASYVLSITSVFILTALLVLFVAVAMTLLILKRSRSFNMHNGNLPRLKIPLWHTTPGLKKHSGSVYRPLSEELSLPRTPIMNRYEFKTPQVHSYP